jgi:hypothetical protein
VAWLLIPRAHARTHAQLGGHAVTDLFRAALPLHEGSAPSGDAARLWKLLQDAPRSVSAALEVRRSTDTNASLN